MAKKVYAPFVISAIVFLTSARSFTFVKSVFGIAPGYRQNKWYRWCFHTMPLVTEDEGLPVLLHRDIHQIILARHNTRDYLL